MRESLDGEWEMAYTHEAPGWSGVPDLKAFCSSLPVPGIWDDHPARFDSFQVTLNPDYAKIEFPIEGSTSPDSSLPHIVGTVWLRKVIEFNGPHALLHVGGVRTEAWAWLDGKYLGHHLGHSTAFEFSLPVASSGNGELILAVSNLRKDRLGCDLRGFAGRSGGITRSVEVINYERAVIRDVYIRCDDSLSILTGEVSLAGDTSGTELEWEIFDSKSQSPLAEGCVRNMGDRAIWMTPCHSMPAWSDEEPHLLKARVVIRFEDGTKSPIHKQCIGLRRLIAQDGGLFLNGEPIYLRGATEHAYFPATTVPPADLETYRRMLEKLKAVGFNWLRFHTWVPPEEYLSAADELGMLIQIEPPVGAGESEWTTILLAARKHPSVVIVCAGNEEKLDEQKIAQLEGFANLTKRLAPDMLFSPQEALRGVEYCWRDEDFGSPVAQSPFLHNPVRLDALREFSDVFSPYTWGMLSYRSISGDSQVIDRFLDIYKKPCLAHEITINGSFLDFSLRQRHQHTRAGDSIYSAAWQELERAGFTHRAAELHRLSCAWMRILRKHCVETARRCRRLSGYDLLGAVDYHWHRHGYPCGIMNEFFEMKPEETATDVLSYNGASILLLDLGVQRNFRAGSLFSAQLEISHFDRSAGDLIRANWRVVDSSGSVIAQGEILDCPGSLGKIFSLKRLEITLPHEISPQKLTIKALASFERRTIENQWDIWTFPAPKAPPVVRPKVISSLDNSALIDLEQGKNLMLLGTGGLPSLPLTFQISVAGRPNGNLALPIHSHPIWKNFPHEGFCDWQFFPLIEDSRAVDFRSCTEAFQPILEVVSSFKRMIPQAALFEWRVGKGRLRVCSLNLQNEDPASAWLRAALFEYFEGPIHGEPPVVDSAQIKDLIKPTLPMQTSLDTDKGFDAGGQIPSA